MRQESGNPNRNHRRRLKKRFRERGLDEFLDHQALELLLFYAIPRRDVNPLAHRLLERFGSLAGVMEAPAAELTKIQGVGERTADMLKMVAHLVPRYVRSRAAPGVPADTPDQAAAILEDHFFAASADELYALLLDGAQRVTSCRYMGQTLKGQNARSLAQSASREGAAGVILGLSRSGEPALTPDEEAAVNRMKQALGRMGIHFQDVLIFTGEQRVSLSQIGLL
jgi:DNA repair protein RadC